MFSLILYSISPVISTPSQNSWICGTLVPQPLSGMVASIKRTAKGFLRPIDQPFFGCVEVRLLRYLNLALVSAELVQELLKLALVQAFQLDGVSLSFGHLCSGHFCIRRRNDRANYCCGANGRVFIVVANCDRRASASSVSRYR